MPHPSFDSRQREDPNFFMADDKKPGDFRWVENFRGNSLELWVLVPDRNAAAGETCLGACIVRSAPGARAPIWTWDGNKDRPTLSPSIKIEGANGEAWHGFLRNGRFEGV